MTKKVLLLPSAWCNEELFSEQIDGLGEEFDFEYIDLGLYSSIEQAADDLVKKFDKVYAVIGLSLGGLVIQHLLSKQPDFAKKIILMSTLATEPRDEMKKMYPELIEKLKHGDLPELTQLLVDVCLFHKEDRNKVEKVKMMIKHTGEERIINHLTAASQYKDLTKGLSQITAKTLLLVGKEDIATPVSDHEHIAKHIPGAKLGVVDDSGHFIPIDKPEVLTKLWREFLRVKKGSVDDTSKNTEIEKKQDVKPEGKSKENIAKPEMEAVKKDEVKAVETKRNAQPVKNEQPSEKKE